MYIHPKELIGLDLIWCPSWWQNQSNNMSCACQVLTLTTNIEHSDKGLTGYVDTVSYHSGYFLMLRCSRMENSNKVFINCSTRIMCTCYYCKPIIHERRQWKQQNIHKVCRHYSATFLNWTHTFHWCMVKQGSETKQHRDTCLKEIRLRLQI